MLLQPITLDISELQHNTNKMTTIESISLVYLNILHQSSSFAIDVIGRFVLLGFCILVSLILHGLPLLSIFLNICCSQSLWLCYNTTNSWLSEYFFGMRTCACTDIPIHVRDILGYIPLSIPTRPLLDQTQRFKCKPTHISHHTTHTNCITFQKVLFSFYADQFSLLSVNVAGLFFSYLHVCLFDMI